MAANEKVSLELEIELSKLRQELSEATDLTAREARGIVSQFASSYRQLAKTMKAERVQQKADAKSAAAERSKAAKATEEAERRILAAQRAVMSEAERIASVNDERLAVVERLAEQGAEESRIAELRAALEAQIAHEAALRAKAVRDGADAEQATEATLKAEADVRARIIALEREGMSVLQRKVAAVNDELKALEAARAAKVDDQLIEQARAALLTKRAGLQQQIAANEEAEAAKRKQRQQDEIDAAKTAAAAKQAANQRVADKLAVLTGARGKAEQAALEANRKELAAIEKLVEASSDAAAADELRTRTAEAASERLARARLADAGATEATLKAEAEVRARIIALEREGMSVLERKVAAVNDELKALEATRAAKVDDQLIEQARAALLTKRAGLLQQIAANEDAEAAKRKQRTQDEIDAGLAAAAAQEAANQRMADKLAVLTGARGKAEQAALEANRKELAAIEKLVAASSNAAVAEELRTRAAEAANERLVQARLKDAEAAASNAAAVRSSAESSTAALQSIGAAAETEGERVERAFREQLHEIDKLAAAGAERAQVEAAYVRIAERQAEAQAKLLAKQAEQAKRAAEADRKAAEQVAAAQQRVTDMIEVSAGKRGLAEQQVIEAYRREIAELDRLQAAGADEADVTKLREQAKEQLTQATEAAIAVDQRAQKLMATGRARTDAYAQAQREASKTGKGFKSTMGAVAQQMPDVVQQLQAGTDATTVLVQQGLQVAQVEMHNIIGAFKSLGKAAIPLAVAVGAATVAYGAYKMAAEDAKNGTDSLDRKLRATAAQFKRVREGAEAANSAFGEFSRGTKDLQRDIDVALGNITEGEADLQRKLESVAKDSREFILQYSTERVIALNKVDLEEQKLAEMQAKRARQLEERQEKAEAVEGMRAASGQALVTVTEKQIDVQRRRVEGLTKSLAKDEAKFAAAQREVQLQENLVRTLHVLELRDEAAADAKDRATDASERLAEALEAERDIKELLAGLERGRMADAKAFEIARERAIAQLERSYAEEASIIYTRNRTLEDAFGEMAALHEEHYADLEAVRERYAVPVQQNPLLASEENATRKLEELYAKRLELARGNADEQVRIREQQAADMARLDEEYALRREVVALREQKALEDLVEASRQATLKAAGIEETAASQIHAAWSEAYAQLEEVSMRRRELAMEDAEVLQQIQLEHEQASLDLQSEYLEQMRIAEEDAHQEALDRARQHNLDSFNTLTRGLDMMLGGLGSMAANMQEIMENTQNMSRQQALAFFRFQKGVAMAEAVVAGAVAVQKALALGPILGPPAAAVMTAATAVQIAAIASANPGGRGGGGGGGGGGGSRNAQATREMREQAGFPGSTSSAAPATPPPPPGEPYGSRHSRSGASSSRSAGSTRNVRAVVRYDHKTHDSFMRDHDRLPGSQARRGQEKSTFIGRERR